MKTGFVARIAIFRSAARHALLTRLIVGAFLIAARNSGNRQNEGRNDHVLFSNPSQRRPIECRIISVNSAWISVPSNTTAMTL